VVNPDTIGTLPTELPGIKTEAKWLIPIPSGLYQLSYRGILSDFQVVNPTLADDQGIEGIINRITYDGQHIFLIFFILVIGLTV
jgi:hypothetical protein